MVAPILRSAVVKRPVESARLFSARGRLVKHGRQIVHLLVFPLLTPPRAKHQTQRPVFHHIKNAAADNLRLRVHSNDTTSPSDLHVLNSSTSTKFSFTASSSSIGPAKTCACSSSFLHCCSHTQSHLALPNAHHTILASHNLPPIPSASMSIDIDHTRRNKKPRLLSESERDKLDEFIDNIHYSSRSVSSCHAWEKTRTFS